MSVTRPVLRYHGGKFMLRGWIVAHFQPHRIYTEAFGGGASVLLAKPRSCGEVYNDLDSSVVRLFRVLRDAEASRRLAEQLFLTPFSREEFESARATDTDQVGDDVEAARLLVSRSFMGFAGASRGPGGQNVSGFRAKGWRSNRSAPADWEAFPESLQAVTARLRGVEIENRPAVEVLQAQDYPDSLHYVDPPYLAETRGRVRGYNHEMTAEDHVQLAEVLRALRGHVVLSGYASSLYEDLYAGWYRVQRQAFANGGLARVEVLWSNRPFHPLLEGS